MNQKELIKDPKPLRPNLTSSTNNFNSNVIFASSEYEHQASIIRKQDEDLEVLGENIQRLGTMGRSINEELVDQERLIIDVEHDIDTTATRIDFVHKKLELMIVKAGSNGQIFMIVFLIVLLIVFIILVFYT